MKRSILCLSVALAMTLTACSRGPEATAGEFSRAVYSGKTAEAMERLDPSIVQMGGPKLMAMTARAGKSAAANGGLKDIRTFDEKVDGDYATVQVERTFGDGSKRVETVKTRKVDGKWYVTM